MGQNMQWRERLLFKELMFLRKNSGLKNWWIYGIMGIWKGRKTVDYYEMGERIRKYRRMQEFSQEKAAEQANLPQKYFSRLKRRQDNPNV